MVFAGPSLPPDERPSGLRFIWRGPARAGDALDLLGEPSVSTVVLIDGLFDSYPAIRHKELLILIGAGMRVIGGASMGALRACELRSFGMEGVGQVFRAYARGQLTGDDEVALLHGPEEAGWNGLTEPLVNVRATLVQAIRRGVIRAEAARRLRSTAAAIHFSERTWDAVLGAFASEPGLAAFTSWLPSNRVDVKRQDALLCLNAALNPGVRWIAGPPPATVFTEALARLRPQSRAQASI
jgi:hypothetical protein